MTYVQGASETDEEEKRQKGQAYCPWFGTEGEREQKITTTFLLEKLMSKLQ
jgi:hypothetical protein